MTPTRTAHLPSARSRSWGRSLGVAATVVVACFSLGVMGRAKAAHPPAVSAMSRAGHPVRWTRSEVVLELVVPTGASSFAADLTQAIESGAREWNAALGACGPPKLRVARGSVGRIRQDGRSVILVRTDSWCPDGVREREDCYDRKRAAITHLYPVQSISSPHDGEVDEADIEVNGVDYRWSLDGEAPGTFSLRALIAHELGHVLGLDHSCSMSPPSPAQGSSLPSCFTPQAAASIMYPEPAELGHAPVISPGDNEVATLCALYKGHPRSEAP